MSRTRRRMALSTLVGVLSALFAACAITIAGPAAAAPVVAPLAPVVAPAAPGVSAIAPVPGDVDDFTFDAFEADYTLTRAADGTSRLAVVETIVAVFPESDQNRGIRRLIPDTYKDQPLRPHLVSLTDENGAPRESEVEDDDGVFGVVSRADTYVHGRQTYVLTYTLENVTWDFPDTGLEFFWNVNGVDWAQPFAEVTARLHLEPDLAAQLTGAMSCYQGVKDAKDACAAITAQKDAAGAAVIEASARGLGPHQTLTIAVGFAPGAFTVFDSSYLASPLGWLQGVAGLGLVGAGALAVRARRRSLADEPGRPTIIAEYDPPANVDALESAVLLGKRDKAIPAEILEQAVAGSIRIVEGERNWRGKTKLVAELIDPARADADGNLLLQALFPSGVPGETYAFGGQDSRFASKAQKLLSAADRELTSRGLRREVKPGARGWPIGVAVVTGILVFVLGAAAMGAGVQAAVPTILIVAAVLMVAMVIALVVRRPLSREGAETRDHLRGLEEFIAWAEADRIRMLQSPSGAERVAVDVNDPRQKLALYEKLLPFAVVFGQEKEWSRQLAVLYTAVGASGPYWYYGTASFDASSFSSSIGSLSAAASSSSSTGGSSGGGSAGGGGGGGGGGGV